MSIISAHTIPLLRACITAVCSSSSWGANLQPAQSAQVQAHLVLVLLGSCQHLARLLHIQRKWLLSKHSGACLSSLKRLCRASSQSGHVAEDIATPWRSAQTASDSLKRLCKITSLPAYEAVELGIPYAWAWCIDAQACEPWNGERVQLGCCIARLSHEQCTVSLDMTSALCCIG